MSTWQGPHGLSRSGPGAGTALFSRAKARGRPRHVLRCRSSALHNFRQCLFVPPIANCGGCRPSTIPVSPRGCGSPPFAGVSGGLRDLSRVADGVTVYDDFAHRTRRAVRRKTPGRVCTRRSQPRTRGSFLFRAALPRPVGPVAAVVYNTSFFGPPHFRPGVKGS